MAGEEAAALLIIGAYWLFFKISQQIDDKGYYIKEFLYIVCMFMALSGIQTGLQLATGGATIYASIENVFILYLIITVACFMYACILVAAVHGLRFVQKIRETFSQRKKVR